MTLSELLIALISIFFVFDSATLYLTNISFIFLLVLYLISICEIFLLSLVYCDIKGVK